MAREVIQEPVQIGGYEFTPGTTIVMAQWVSHRDPRFFDDPEAFPAGTLARWIGERRFAAWRLLPLRRVATGGASGKALR